MNAVQEASDDNKKAFEDTKVSRDLKMLESKLMTVIMTPKPLTQKHKTILDLSAQIKEKTPVPTKVTEIKLLHPYTYVKPF